VGWCRSGAERSRPRQVCVGGGREAGTHALTRTGTHRHAQARTGGWPTRPHTHTRACLHTYAGLRWNLADTPMEVGGLISTCNVIDADEVVVTTDAPLLWMTETPSLTP
jgi:hypothetical protein